MQDKVTQQNRNPILENVIDNAFDFLSKSTDEFENQTKYSVINFFCAIELFLKARLITEHWSLIVGKNPNLNKFLTGDSQTIQFDELVKKLNEVFEQPQLEKEKIEAFNDIRIERNKLIHFFHKINVADDTKLSEIKTELAVKQLKAWHYLKELLIAWSVFFKTSSILPRIYEIENKLSKLKKYYDLKFEAVKGEIERNKKENNKEYYKCEYCGKEAKLKVYENHGYKISKCIVCNSITDEKLFTTKCKTCGKITLLDICKVKIYEKINLDCGHIMNIKELLNQVKCIHGKNAVSYLDTHFMSLQKAESISCDICKEKNSVSQLNGYYICINCGTYTNQASRCETCKTWYIGQEMPGKFKNRCSFCSDTIYD